MITFLHLWYAMKRAYPSLVLGQHYVIGFPVDPANPTVQTGDSTIVKWTPDDMPMPTAFQQGALCDFYEAAFIAQEQATAIRAQRRSLLGTADMLVALAQQSGNKPYEIALRRYRQALRDVTKQPGFPATVVWPALPTETS
jgi:hypothetical protein